MSLTFNLRNSIYMLIGTSMILGGISQYSITSKATEPIQIFLVLFMAIFALGVFYYSLHITFKELGKYKKINTK